MRLNTTRLIATVAIALSMTGAAPAFTKEGDEALRVNSLSGAYLAARIAETDNDLDSAIRYFERALSFDPTNQTVQQSLLIGLISQGSFDEALPYAESLAEVPEVERFSRLALAVDAVRKGEFADAEHFLKLSLESDLDRLITGLMAAWARLGAGEADAALARLDEMAGPEWYNLFVGYHRGLIAEHAGKAEVAKEAYEAVAANPAAGAAAPDAYMRALESYAGFLAREGDKEGAEGVLDRADTFASNRITIEALRKNVEAGTPVERLVDGPVEGTAEALLNLATALNRGGGESFVRLYLQYALALTPKSDQVLIQLAGVAEQQEDGERAIRYYEAIPAESPIKHVAELQLGLNLADLDRHEEAIEHLVAVLYDDPEDMRAYLALGGVYASEERYAEAAELYDRAAARIETPAREDWNIFYQRGIAYERVKQWDKAEPNFRQALELFPDQPQVLNYLGYSWVDMNMNLEEGLDLIKRAVELRPSDGYIVDSLGWAHYRLGNYEEAVKELERAVGLMPNDPVLNDHLGDAYWRVGRRLEATFQWRHTRDMEPEPDVLASVQKKLAEGLPPADDRAEAEDAVEEPAEREEASLAPAMVPMPATPDAAPQDAPVEAVAPAASAPAADAGTAGTYVVLPGQSLWSIAAEQLGDGNRYQELLDLNPGLRGDPGRLVPGQELRLPGPAE